MINMKFYLDKIKVKSHSLVSIIILYVNKSNSIAVIVLSQRQIFLGFRYTYFNYIKLFFKNNIFKNSFIELLY